jgi:hypothetical protein
MQTELEALLNEVGQQAGVHPFLILGHTLQVDLLHTQTLSGV